MPETTYTSRTHHGLSLYLFNRPVRVTCTLDETTDLLTGDQTLSMSIDDIVDSESGQTYFTKHLTLEQFRGLMSSARRQIHQL